MPQWQWTFQTPEASYHVIAPSWGGEVIRAFLAGVEPEVWGSDLYSPQMLTPATEHQICMSHQERDLTFAIEADAGDARLWAIELRRVFGRAIRLHHERGQVTPETFARRLLLIENATDRLVFDCYVAPQTEAARLQKRYRLHRDSLHVFRHRDDVEPTNNSPSVTSARPSSIARSSAPSAPPGSPRPRRSAPASSPPLASKAGTGSTPPSPSPARHPIRLCPPAPDRSLVGPLIALRVQLLQGRAVNSIVR